MDTPKSLTTDALPESAVTKLKTGVIGTAQLKDMYRKMLLIRRVEEALLEMAESGKIGGAMHTAIGHEANAVGSAAALEPGDYVTCTYRGHHHALAHGLDAKYAIAEVLGKETGMSGGKAGSMHFIYPPIGLMAANGIVGAQVPQAAGLALSAWLRDEKRIAQTFFGDGALYQGVMHETFNIAQKWRLPIIFYCENNRYSEMTPIGRTSSVQEIYTFVQAYGMPSVQIDGNDAEVVYHAVKEAADRARNGGGPSFIEGLTYRLSGHMAGDLETYRSTEEVELQRKTEPLNVVADRLEQQGVSPEELDQIRAYVASEVAAAVKFAEESPYPDRAQAYTDVFVD
jgi:acetoin:2,6-dichlorophenolindophenol oxidoreductase subunit alpha